MGRIDLVRQAVAEQLDNPYDLLALRLMFPPDWVQVDINKEISDLYTYPERLATSYYDEWRSLAVRGLFDHGFRDHWRSEPENLEAYVEYLRRDAIPRCIHNHIELFRRLGEILQIASADNTLVFRDPRRRAVMKLIWPERD